MKAYIDSALNTINTPLYRNLCLQIIKNPTGSTKEVIAIKKMLLNSYYSSAMRPFENIELTDADYGASILLWLAFSDHPNKIMQQEQCLWLQFAEDDLITLTVKMVNSLSKQSSVLEYTGIWKSFIKDLDKTTKLAANKQSA